MENFITPVVNSKEATKDLFDIKSRHADMLVGMQNQATRVQAYNQERQNQMTIENQAKTQADTERMKIQSEADKNRMAMEQKNKELEVKRLALTQD